MSRTRSAADGDIHSAAAPGARRDADLVKEVALGDRRAFEQLYRAYHPRLARFLTHMLRRPHLVEEVLNDAMMVVWRRAESYNGASRVSTWIFAIAYRSGLKASRRWKDPVEDKDAESRTDPGPGPDRPLDDHQRRQLLLKALSALSADHRMVVDLTYFHELSYLEIAQVMDCPVDTVKTRMFHARKRLRGLLNGGLVDWL